LFERFDGSAASHFLPQAKKHSMRSDPHKRSALTTVVFGTLFAVAVAAIAIYLLNPLGTASSDPRLRIFGVSPLTISSVSMLPTLNAGDVIVVSALATRLDGVQRSDLVVPSPQRLFASHLTWDAQSGLFSADEPIKSVRASDRASRRDVRHGR